MGKHAHGSGGDGLTFYRRFYTAAISYRLWSVHRQTKRAGLRVNDSIVLVRTGSHLLFPVLKGADKVAADSER